MPVMKRVAGIIFALGVYAGLAAQPAADEVAPSGSQGTTIYHQHGKVGLSKASGKILTPPVYDSLLAVTSNIYVARKRSSAAPNPQWGLIDKDGKVLVPFAYHSLQPQQGLLIASKQSRNLVQYGVLTLTGEVLVPIRYEKATVLGGQFINAGTGHEQHIFNTKGEKLLTLTADSLDMPAPGLLRYYRLGKCGLATLANPGYLYPEYVDLTLQEGRLRAVGFPRWFLIHDYDSLALTYDSVVPWQGKFIVRLRHKSYLINSANQPQSAVYDTLVPLSDDLLLAKTNGYAGVLNREGELIVPAAYQTITADKEVIYARKPGVQGKWRLFDHYGYPKTQVEYERWQPMQDGLIAVQRHGKWGFINRYGIEVISPIYDAVGPFKNGLARVTFFGEDGLIDRQGEWRAYPFAGHILDYDSRIILAKSGRQFQLRHLDGELIYFTNNRLEPRGSYYAETDTAGHLLRLVSPQGTLEEPASGHPDLTNGGAGLVIFRQNGRYGFKDQRGRIIVANRYEAVKPFYNDLAAVQINGKWGFIDHYEHLVVQPVYDSVADFNNDYCLTWQGGAVGALDRHGKVLIRHEYEEIIPLPDKRFKVKRHGRWGLLDERGRMVVQPTYDRLTPVSQGYYIVARLGRYGTLDRNGVSLVPLIYDYIGYDEASGILITRLPAEEKWLPLPVVAGDKVVH